MVSGLSTSPYDQDKIVSGEAKLIRSAVSPLVSTVFSLRRLHPEPRLCIAYSRLVRETNKGKRFESFLSSACDILLGFLHPMRILYAEKEESQGYFARFLYEFMPHSD